MRYSSGSAVFPRTGTGKPLFKGNLSELAKFLLSHSTQQFFRSDVLRHVAAGVWLFSCFVDIHAQIPQGN